MYKRQAPIYGDYLNQESQDFYAAVKAGLKALSIPYTENEQLVRGLDYYSHTVFEIKSDALGAQSTVLAGGRYDGLVKIMGGPPTPGVGWAAGVDRLAMLVSEVPEYQIDAVIMPMDSSAETFALIVSRMLRSWSNKFNVIFDFSGSLKKRFARADKLGVKIAIILGEDEYKSQRVTIKNMITGEQATVNLDEFVNHIGHMSGRFKLNELAQ